MNVARRRTLSALAALAALAACGTPGTAWQWVYLPAALPADPGGALPSAAATALPASTVNWQLLGVKLPAYLDRTDVLARRGAAGLAVVPGVRWAEPLADAVPRVLLEDLAARLGRQRVWVAPLPPGVVTQRQLRVEVTSFEADEAQRSVRLGARWTVSEATGGASFQDSTVIEVRVAEPGVDALLAAHRAALGRLADRIAAK